MFIVPNQSHALVAIEFRQYGAARVSASQFGLPLDELDPRTARPPFRNSTRGTPARPIHVSAFERAGNNFYATPSWVTEDFAATHPAFAARYGNHAAATAPWPLSSAGHGYTVVSSDIADRGFGTPGVDFLACR